MAPTSVQYPSQESAAAQDAFDAKLNQTIFVFAFVIAGLVQLGVLGYLGYWLLAKYRRVRALKDETLHKHAPRQLMLPGRVDTTSSLRKLRLSPFSPLLRSSSPSPEVDDYRMKDLERQQSWPGSSPGGLPDDLTNQLAGADVFTQDIINDAPRLSLKLAFPLEIDLGTYDSAVLSSASASTVVQVMDSDGSVPRIIVEDFAHPSFFEDSEGSETDCNSEDMSIDDEKVGVGLLAVPPMTWNAPRALVEEKYETALDLPLLRQSKPMKKSSSVSRFVTILSDISNVARLRPKSPIPGSFDSKSSSMSSLSRTSSRVGRATETTLTYA